jgi:hypothetical protein
MQRNPAERENNPIFISHIFHRIPHSDKAVFTRAYGLPDRVAGPGLRIQPDSCIAMVIERPAQAAYIQMDLHIAPVFVYHHANRYMIVLGKESPE